MPKRLIYAEDAIDALKAMALPLHLDSACEDIWERDRTLDNAIDVMRGLPSAQPETHDKRTETHACDFISRQAAIDRINKQREHLQPDIYPQDKIGDAAYRICAEFIERLPSAQPEQRWIPVTKEEMFKAGYEGREIRFRVDGRLFAIRELAQ